MEAAAAAATAFGFSISFFKPPNSMPTLSSVRFASKCALQSSLIKQYPSISHVKLGNTRASFRSRKCDLVRASLMSPDSGGSPASIAPLQLESPIGQFLSQILVSHPHLVPAAVEQQLEQFQTDREAGKQNDEPSAAGTDLVLYRRIAEVKANERRKALEEILYALVVQKFMDAKVPLMPTLTANSSVVSGQVDTWPVQDDKLELLHSPAAYEMIQNHLTLILGNRLGDLTSVTLISKLRVAQVYAASVMYGYFLKRVDQRFQLEKTMKILSQGLDDTENSIQRVGEEFGTSSYGNQDSSQTAQTHPGISSWSGDGIGPRGHGHGNNSSRLRNYVMSFDGETLHRCATMRSKEAVTIIDKHTEALFGRHEYVVTPLGTFDSSKGEEIKISFGGLKRLILEAVTFGSFLWDVESYVDSRYNFVAN